MRFEYRVHPWEPQLDETIVVVEVFLTHRTGDRLLGHLKFNEDGSNEFKLWKVSMNWNPLNVLITEDGNVIDSREKACT